MMQQHYQSTLPLILLFVLLGAIYADNTIIKLPIQNNSVLLSHDVSSSSNSKTASTTPVAYQLDSTVSYSTSSSCTHTSIQSCNKKLQDCAYGGSCLRTTTTTSSSNKDGASSSSVEEVCTVLGQYVDVSPPYIYRTVRWPQSSIKLQYKGMSLGQVLICTDDLVTNTSPGHVLGLGKFSNTSSSTASAQSIAQYLKSTQQISKAEVGLCLGRGATTSSVSGHMYLGGMDRSTHREPMVYALDSHPQNSVFTLQARALYLTVPTDDINSNSKGSEVRVTGVSRNGNTLNRGSAGYVLSTYADGTVLNASYLSIFASAWDKLLRTKTSTNKSTNELPDFRTFIHTAQSEHGIALSTANVQSLPSIVLQVIGYNTNDTEDPTVVPGYAARYDGTHPYDVLLRITPDMYLTPMQSADSNRINNEDNTVRYYRTTLSFDSQMSYGGIIGRDVLRYYSVLLSYEASRPGIGFALADCDIISDSNSSNSTNDNSESNKEGNIIDKQKQDCTLGTFSVFQGVCSGTIGSSSNTISYRTIIQTEPTTQGTTCEDVITHTYPDASEVECDTKRGYCDMTLVCNSDGYTKIQTQIPISDNQGTTDTNTDDVFDDDVNTTYNASTECNRQSYGQCTLECQQSRLVSYLTTLPGTKTCEVHSTLTRDCSTGLCAKDLPCKVPYKVHLVLGIEYNSIRGNISNSDTSSVSAWTLNAIQKEDLLASLAQTLDGVHPGDLEVTLVTPWYSNDDLLLDTTDAIIRGIKLVIEIHVVNRAYNPILDVCDDVSNAPYRTFANSVHNHITSPSYQIPLPQSILMTTTSTSDVKVYILQTWSIATVLNTHTIPITSPTDTSTATKIGITLVLLSICSVVLYSTCCHSRGNYMQAKEQVLYSGRKVGANLMNKVRIMKRRSSNSKSRGKYNRVSDLEESDLIQECQ